MRTITVSPGEEIRIVCEGPAMNNNKSNNKGNNKSNNKSNNKRANLNYNNSNAENMNYPENDENSNSNSNSNTSTDDDELEDMNSVSGGKRPRKTRKASKKGRKGTQKGGKKRGPNGYMKFSAEMRPKILKEYPELKSDVVSVARKIGEAWRKMSDAEKKKY